MGLWEGPPARVEIQRVGETATVVVHAAVHPALKVVLSTWLGLWAIVESLALRNAASGADLLFTPAFGRVWLLGWTAVGLAAGWALAWCFYGVETLSCDGRTFVYRLAVGPLARTRRFDAQKVKGPWLHVTREAALRNDRSGDQPVWLGFDDRWWTYQLRARVTERDGKAIVDALRRGPWPAAAPRPESGAMGAPAPRP